MIYNIIYQIYTNKMDKINNYNNDDLLDNILKIKSTKQKSSCAICKSEIFYSQRYPNAVCNNCREKTIDSSGNPVYHCNVDEQGGFESIHIIGENKIKKNDHDCWIDGIKCYSDEARFGGIIIQRIMDK